MLSPIQTQARQWYRSLNLSLKCDLCIKYYPVLYSDELRLDEYYLLYVTYLNEGDEIFNTDDVDFGVAADKLNKRRANTQSVVEL